MRMAQNVELAALLECQGTHKAHQHLLLLSVPQKYMLCNTFVAVYNNQQVAR